MTWPLRPPAPDEDYPAWSALLFSALRNVDALHARIARDAPGPHGRRYGLAPADLAQRLPALAEQPGDDAAGDDEPLDPRPSLAFALTIGGCRPAPATRPGFCEQCGVKLVGVQLQRGRFCSQDCRTITATAQRRAERLAAPPPADEPPVAPPDPAPAPAPAGPAAAIEQPTRRSHRDEQRATTAARIDELLAEAASRIDDALDELDGPSDDELAGLSRNTDA